MFGYKGFCIGNNLTLRVANLTKTCLRSDELLGKKSIFVNLNT